MVGPAIDGPLGGRPRWHRLTRQLAYRAPLDVHATLRFHGVHAVAGVEAWDGTTFTRTLQLPGGPGRIALARGTGPGVQAVFELAATADIGPAVAIARRLLDLDMDPVTVDAALGRHRDLAGLVAARPGLRSPGGADAAELAIRTIVGQQVSLAGARTVLARIVGALGERAFADDPGWMFPTAAALAAADPAMLPLPRARRDTVTRVATAIAAGDLDLRLGVDVRTALLATRGIGRWTADYLAMRAFGDPDVLLETDLAVRRVATALQIDLTAGGRFAPWRSYVTHHLWAVALAGPAGNQAVSR